jgi:DNA-binding MurR/RpiR family transcriptional regulator
MNAQNPEESLYLRAIRIGPSLPGTLERVATFFAQHPDRTAASSAAEIATFTGTSDASVIRTAHALGYSGMKDLKRAALELVSERVDPEKVLEQRIERVRDHSITGVIDDTVHAASRTRHTISPEVWDQAVQILARARRVFCYGLKPVGFIGDYLAHMFNRVGVDARSSHQTGVLLADYMLPLTEEDAVVIFAPIRQFDEVGAVVRHAKHIGASVVLITEAIGMPIRNEVDCTLTTSPTSMSAASDLSLPLTVAHGLFLGVAALLPHRAIETMTRLNELRPTVSPQKASLTLEDLGLAHVVRSSSDKHLP